MSKENSQDFTNAEGLAITLSYLFNPADVHCPECGPGTMEVVAFLENDRVSEGAVPMSSPDGDYTVVLYCHECNRAAAFNVSSNESGSNDKEAYDKW